MYETCAHRASDRSDARVSLLLQPAAAAVCALQAAIGGDASRWALQLAAQQVLHAQQTDDVCFPVYVRLGRQYLHTLVSAAGKAQGSNTKDAHDFFKEQA